MCLNYTRENIIEGERETYIYIYGFTVILINIITKNQSLNIIFTSTLTGTNSECLTNIFLVNGHTP